jgi:hypothetical protein
MDQKKFTPPMVCDRRSSQSKWKTSELLSRIFLAQTRQQPRVLVYIAVLAGYSITWARPALPRRRLDPFEEAAIPSEIARRASQGQDLAQGLRKCGLRAEQPTDGHLPQSP